MCCFLIWALPIRGGEVSRLSRMVWGTFFLRVPIRQRGGGMGWGGVGGLKLFGQCTYRTNTSQKGASLMMIGHAKACTWDIFRQGLFDVDQADYNDGNSDIDDWSYILRSPKHTWIISRQRLVEVSLSSGNYSRLLADVIFTRSMGYYMIQVILGYFGIFWDTTWYRWFGSVWSRFLVKV